MLDATPRPFGDLTRRWTQLDPTAQQAHAARLLAGGCDTPGSSHVDDPGLDRGACYRRLVVAARSGDDVAWGWVADTHRPTLLRHGRWAMQDDPGEWGVLAFDVLVRVVTLTDPDSRDEQWLRRHVAGRLAREMSLVRQRLRRRREFEVAFEPATLARLDLQAPEQQPDLAFADVVVAAMADLDAPTRHALLEVADGGTIRDVASLHGLPYKTLHQRVQRARLQLRPKLADHARAVLA